MNCRVQTGLSMTPDPSTDRQTRIHSRIAVLINSFVGTAIGATFGAFQNLAACSIGGLVLGALLGLANEAFFRHSRRLAHWYRLRTVILVLGEAFLVFYGLIPAFGVYHTTHPTRVPVVGSPADLGMANYEDVTLSAAEGITLRGWYIPSRNGAAIIAVHGADANRSQMLGHARALAQAGYGVLLFDLRADGESDGTLFPVTDATSDVSAALAYLRSRQEIDPGRIGAVGLSLGAEVLLQAAAGDPSLKALIADGATTNTVRDLLRLPPRYRLLYAAAPMWWMSDRTAALMSGAPARPLVELVEKIPPRPILFISSNEEPEPLMNRRLYEHAGPAAQLWELPDTGHVGGIFAHPEEYKQRMITFFDAALLTGGPAVP
jgi:dienelactone hydrolase